MASSSLALFDRYQGIARANQRELHPNNFERTYLPPDVFAHTYESHAAPIAKGGYSFIYDMKKPANMVLKTTTCNTPKKLARALQEADIGDTLQQDSEAAPYCLGIRHMTVLESDATSIVYNAIPKINGTHFQEAVITNPNLSLLHACSLFQDIFKALKALSRLGIVHRDLKPENILVSEDSTSGSLRATLIDYGFSQYCDMQRPKRFSIGGTPGYVHDDVLNECDALPQAIDIFALHQCLKEFLYTTRIRHWCQHVAKKNQDAFKRNIQQTFELLLKYTNEKEHGPFTEADFDVCIQALQTLQSQVPAQRLHQRD